MSDPAPENQDYTVGFMFDPTLQQVALIRKTRPNWQAGKLNGIGGKLEPDERLLNAMAREFLEEAGAYSTTEQWHYFAKLRGPDWCVHCFVTTGDLDGLVSMTDELVELHPVAALPLKADIVENVPWLVLLARDHLADGRPSFARIEYPSS